MHLDRRPVPSIGQVVGQVVGLILGLSAAAPARANWVASWEAAPAVLSSPGLRATTVRQSVRLSVGGAQLRVRFSNETGTRTLAIGGAHLALPGSAAGAIDPATDRILTFGGATTATVPPGAPLLSDPVDLPVAALSTLVVTALLDGTSPQQPGHVLAGDTAYLLPGDHTGDTVLAGAAASTSRFALSGVEVGTPGQASATVGTLGDSITDGVSATVDRHHRWTDRLAERFAARTGGAVLGVVNGGIAGNAVTGGVLLDTQGQSALARLDRDVLARPGLRWLVLFEGINDILFSPSPAATASDLVAGYREIIARAHDRGIKVVAGTLAPVAGVGPAYAYSAAKEAARAAVNGWIRTGGEFDGTVDFDAALRDPSRPLALRPAYDSGDHLHPNDAGYRAMGDAVPLALFQ